MAHEWDPFWARIAVEAELARGLSDADIAALFNSNPKWAPPPPTGSTEWDATAIRTAALRARDRPPIYTERPTEEEEGA